MVRGFIDIVRGSLPLAWATLLLTACSDPVVPVDTESTSTGTIPTDTGTGCTAGESRACTCPDGTAGTQVCDISGLFGDCQCEGESLDSGSTGSDTTTTGPQPCASDQECADAAATECEVGVCGDDGMCATAPAPVDTPCGDATSLECSAADTCDGNGQCMPNHVDDGLTCTTCASGQCTCAAGACDECSVFAPANNFITPRSIEGWELTGSWALYRQTPSTEVALASEFPSQVLGTNGNRVAPFPGAEVEQSHARTRPFPLPAEIVFLSWHVDEGGALGSDNKTVRVSVDGGVTWDTLADCAADPIWPFCTANMDQGQGAFNLVQIPVPAALQGQEGIVEFGYDSGDACCGFEKGWYIDALNVATECSCQADTDCAAFGGECGTPTCSPAGECALTPLPADTACGDPFDNDCNGADTCDGVGYCRDNEAANGLALCGDCPGGGICAFCDAGQCIDCLNFSAVADFSDPSAISDWVVDSISGTADWGIYAQAPTNHNGAPAVPFPDAPVFGTDGNREFPYPGWENEHSTVTTGEGLVPAAVTFLSWNVDESFDNKIIEISVDGGTSWTALVHCDLGLDPGQPFCQSRDDTRAADDWDLISIDTSAWAGMTGMLRFTYDSQDDCCGHEMGWFIDDLDAFFPACHDEPFPP